MDDPFPHLSGAGYVGLLALPVALFLPFAAQGGRVRGLRILAVLWGFIVSATLVGNPVDSFEARRSLVMASSWLVLFLGGALLDSSGRRLFNRGLLVLSIVLIGASFVRNLTLGEESLPGVLGNPGPLSQAALPGAAIAAWYIATRRGLYWALGWLAFGLFLAHVGLAPVYAGGLSLTCALVASSFLSPWTRRNAQVRKRIGLLAAASVFVIFALRAPTTASASPIDPADLGDLATPAEPTRATASDEATVARDLGGVEVRKRIWSQLGTVSRAHPLFGLGPGQFEARFRPYRDSREAELSRGGVCETAETEVEHAHNDGLQGLFELGPFAGALWILFLALSARAAIRAVREADLPTIGMGVGALALLINGLFHSPLSYYPMTSALGFVLLGAVFARERAEEGLETSKPVRWAVAAIGVFGASFAWPLIAHGDALQDYIRIAKATTELDPARDSLNDALALESSALDALHRAIEHAPDSAPARILLANFDPTPKNRTPGWYAERFAAWQSVLGVRPNNVDAFDRLASLHFAEGRVNDARESWLRAISLAPTQPRFQRELARLELFEGDPDQGLARLALLSERGCDDEHWRAWLGSELVLHGHWRDGARVLFAPDIDALEELVADELNAAAKTSRWTDVPAHAQALRCLAHLLWAREQIADGDLDTAIRSYRQVLAPTRTAIDGGAAAARAELVAALLVAERTSDATAAADGIELHATMFGALPEWARRALRDGGYLPRPDPRD